MKMKFTFLLFLYACFTGKTQVIEQKGNITNFLARKKILPEELIDKIRLSCKTTKTVSNRDYIQILKKNSWGKIALPLPNTYGSLWVTQYGSLYSLKDKQAQKLLKAFYQYEIITKETYNKLRTSYKTQGLETLHDFFEWTLQKE